MPANMRQHLPNMPQFEMPQFDMPALPQCLSELLRGPTGIPGLLLLLLRQVNNKICFTGINRKIV